MFEPRLGFREYAAYLDPRVMKLPDNRTPRASRLPNRWRSEIMFHRNYVAADTYKVLAI